MTWTAVEMMTVSAARALTDDDVCFVGIGLPSAACNLARLTHAPRLRLVYESGTIETRPDVAIVHAQKADRAGNVLLEGIVGVQKEAVLAARRSLVTVEEIVDALPRTNPNAIVLPSWTVTAIAVARGGAKPSYAHGYYARDNAFYVAWDAISRDRGVFQAWIAEHVLSRSAEVAS